jgi:nitrogen PTS system EIIA component
MDIASFLSRGAVVIDSEATSKRQVLEQIALLADAHTSLQGREVLQAFITRERLGSTAAGRGIALPHARFAGLNKITAFFIRLSQPVEFDSPDGQPVDLLFALLAPTECSSDHLRAMASVSRLLRDARCCEKIRHAVTADVVYHLLTADNEELES